MNTHLPPPLPPRPPRRPHGFIVAMRAIWDAMNFTRRLVLNVLFFMILPLLLLILGAMAGRHGKQVAIAQPHTTLVLEPKGRLVEADSRDPLTRALANASDGDSRGALVRVRDLVQVIDSAAKDSAVERVFLDVDDLQPSGFASLHEVTAALQRLRASGKPVIAFSKGMSQGQYLLAAQASQLYLDPDGYGIQLDGLASYRPFFREGLQDKLGVDVRLFKVGEYKSAAEPYVRDAASPESKEADLFWMNDLWQRYISDIATARRLPAQAVKSSIDNFAQGVVGAQGDLARYALQQKWVDALKTRGEVEDELAANGHADKKAEGGFRQMAYNDYLRSLNGPVPKLPGGSHVAVVVAEGEIVPGKSDTQVGGESTAQRLHQAVEDDSVKAVVLRVNSPGGEVFASEQIRREVQGLKDAGKPVVVSMGDVAASGGYWISMNADRIYADPSTITGSIGIFGLVPNFARALGKLGVHTDGVGTEPLAGAMDPTRPLDPQLAAVIQAVIEKGYRDFTGKVANARHRSVAEIDSIARGRVWSGAQAKERGLVDEFGGLKAAIDDAARRAKLGGNPSVRYIENEGNAFNRFLAGSVRAGVGEAMLRKAPWLRALGAPASQALAHDASLLEASQQQGSAVRAWALCLCGK